MPDVNGVLDRSGQPGVDLHQQRAACPVPAELDLADPLQPDRPGQRHGGLQDVRGGLDAFPQDRGAAERRAGAVCHVPAARQRLAAGEEERDTLAAARGPLLGEHGRSGVDELPGGVDGLGLADNLHGHQAAVGLAGPRDRGLNDEGELELRVRGGQLRDAVDEDGLGPGDAQLAGRRQRAVLVGGDGERVVRRYRQDAAQLGQPRAVRRERHDHPVPRRQHDAHLVGADEVRERVRERSGIGAVARQHHGLRAVPGAERGDRQRRRILGEGLAQRHPQSGPAEAPRAGQALLVHGIEYQGVIALRYPRHPASPCQAATRRFPPARESQNGRGKDPALIQKLIAR